MSNALLAYVLCFLRTDKFVASGDLGIAYFGKTYLFLPKKKQATAK